MEIVFKELIFFTQLASLLFIYNHASRARIGLPFITLVLLILRLLFFISPPICFFLIILLPIVDSFVRNPSLAKTVSLFFGLFPSVMSSLLIRLYSYFVFPAFGFSLIEVENNYVLSFILKLLIFPTYFLIMKYIKVDFTELNKIIKQGDLLKPLVISNISMLVYYFIFQVSIVLDYENGVTFRQYMVIIYGVLFLILIIHLNGGLKERLELDLLNQKNRELQSLISYSRQMEALYEEIREFRHDYLNVLSSLQTGIDNNDMEIVRMVYQSVLEKAGKQLVNRKFHLTNLIQIENEAIKGIVSTKFLEAQNLGIDMVIEIEQAFHDPSIDLLDFITILSILLDNALEAAILSVNPTIKLAFLEDTQQQLVVVENSTKEERISIGTLYRQPSSSKGKGRGLGLVKMRRILEAYPDVTLETQSKDHTFRQTVVFPREELKGLD